MTLFMWMWGFNYCCAPITGQSDLVRIDSSELFAFGLNITGQLNKHASSVDTTHFPPNLNATVRQSVVRQLTKRSIRTWGSPGFHETGFNGALRRLGIAGVYFPFSGQAHCDASFLKCTKIFIMAHELSHAYGITEEAEADFIAYASLQEIESDSALKKTLSYFADLELLRSIRYQLRLIDDSLRIFIDSTLDKNVLDDLSAIRMNAMSYPEYFPGMQESVNDTYLKLMGVEDGIKNYDHFIDLAWDWHQHNPPLLSTKKK